MTAAELQAKGFAIWSHLAFRRWQGPPEIPTHVDDAFQGIWVPAWVAALADALAVEDEGEERFWSIVVRGEEAAVAETAAVLLARSARTGDDAGFL